MPRPEEETSKPGGAKEFVASETGDETDAETPYDSA